MKLAYLINQYPQLSHSFIRREIQALEQLGQPVERISIRPVGSSVDPADRAEAERTWSILGAGVATLVAALLLIALLHPFRLLHAGFMATRLGWRSGRGTLRHWVYLVEACLLLRRSRARQIDHVHAHFGTNSAMVALLTRLLGGPSYSFTVHGPEEFDRPDNLALAEKMRHAAFVVAISSYGRSQLYRWVDAEVWPRIQVVRCGVDAQFLDFPKTEIPTVPRLVCVGRLCEQKGQLLLVQAVARLRDHGTPCELVLVGDGPMRCAIEAEIARARLEDRVILTGPLPGAAVRERILSAKAFVLPSFAEGLPVVLMEALALRRPVVSTYVAGIPELVDAGNVGWLVPAGSVDALVAALEQVLATPNVALETMGDLGHTRVRRLHNIELEAAKLLHCFHRFVRMPDALPIRRDECAVQGDAA